MIEKAKGKLVRCFISLPIRPSDATKISNGHSITNVLTQVN